MMTYYRFLLSLLLGDLWNIQPYITFSPCSCCNEPLLTVVVGQDKDVRQVLVRQHSGAFEPECWVGRCKVPNCNSWVRLSDDEVWRCMLCGIEDQEK